MSVEGLYGADEDVAAISQLLLVVVAGGSWVDGASDIVLSLKRPKKRQVGCAATNRIPIRSGRHQYLYVYRSSTRSRDQVQISFLTQSQASQTTPQRVVWINTTRGVLCKSFVDVF